MAENPAENLDQLPKKLVSLKEAKSKIIGPSMQFSKSNSDIQRIQIASHESQWLTTTPSPIPQLPKRESQPELEVGPRIHFTPKLQMERIHDSLAKRIGYSYSA